MRHKYKVGCWVRFYRAGKLVIGVVEYLPLKELWEKEPNYYTSEGPITESSILEVRYP